MRRRPTIAKVANYAMHGRLKIFSTCDKLRQSLSKYKYPARKVGDDSNQGEIPMDAHNHLPDALRYMMAPFPAFPEDPQDFSSIWREVMGKMQNIVRKEWLWTNEPDHVSSFLDNFG